MRWFHLLVICSVALVWSSCSSQRWVHPSKTEQHLTHDWNQCERDWLNTVTVNPGAGAVHDSPVIEKQRIYRCLQKKGWKQVED